jgi:hypothetical protein
LLDEPLIFLVQAQLRHEYRSDRVMWKRPLAGGMMRLTIVVLPHSN